MESIYNVCLELFDRDLKITTVEFIIAGSVPNQNHVQKILKSGVISRGKPDGYEKLISLFDTEIIDVKTGNVRIDGWMIMIKVEERHAYRFQR